MSKPIVCAVAAAALAFAGVAAAEETTPSPGGVEQHEQMQPPPAGQEPGAMQKQQKQDSGETPSVGAPPQGQQPRAGQPSQDEYVVQKGDTLADIAQRTLGSRDEWKRIAEANGIENPEELKVGQRLTIPAGKSGSKPEPQS